MDKNENIDKIEKKLVSLTSTQLGKFLKNYYNKEYLISVITDSIDSYEEDELVEMLYILEASRHKQS